MTTCVARNKFTGARCKNRVYADAPSNKCWSHRKWEGYSRPIPPAPKPERATLKRFRDGIKATLKTASMRSLLAELERRTEGVPFCVCCGSPRGSDAAGE